MAWGIQWLFLPKRRNRQLMADNPETLRTKHHLLARTGAIARQRIRRILPAPGAELVSSAIGCSRQCMVSGEISAASPFSVPARKGYASFKTSMRCPEGFLLLSIGKLRQFRRVARN
jgi:hypothetical protein